MTFQDDDDWPDGFADALRRHAARTPSLMPAEAARRLRERLEPRPERRYRQWLAPAAAAAAVVLALASASRMRHEDGPAPRPRGVERSTVVVGPLPDNIVLWWADPETPVYFILPSTPTGGQS